MRETGHHCSVCKKPCCNLCNKMEVDDITDILCPRCAEAGEFMGETGERENTTSDREGGGSDAGTANSAPHPSFPSPHSEDWNEEQGDQPSPASSNISCAKAVMKTLLEELSECTQVQYDKSSLAKGFINFSRLRRRTQNWRRYMKNITDYMDMKTLTL